MTEDAKRQLAALLGAVLLFAAIAALAGSAPQPVPDWALRQELIYRMEVALGLFVGLYIPIAMIALARQGRVFTKFGAGPATAEAEALAAADETTKAVEDLRASVQQLSGSAIQAIALVAQLNERVMTLEAAEDDGGGGR